LCSERSDRAAPGNARFTEFQSKMIDSMLFVSDILRFLPGNYQYIFYILGMIRVSVLYCSYIWSELLVAFDEAANYTAWGWSSFLPSGIPTR
jgi:hypothetical protein